MTKSDTFDPSCQIRILELQAGEGKQAIHGELVTYRLHKDPEPASTAEEWEAISYRWDSQDAEKTIDIDGRDTPVKGNVHRMLSQLRSPVHTRRIWVDAICIDQSNEQEKSAQIPLMRQVFEKASRVIIWLDCKGIERHVNAVIQAAEWLPGFLEKAKDMPAVGSKPLRTEINRHHVKAGFHGSFHKILSLGWFRRLWVVQEAVLAQKLVVWMIDREIEWDDFASTALKFMSNYDSVYFEHMTMENIYEHCYHQRYPNRVMCGISMIWLIYIFRYWKFLSQTVLAPSELVYLLKDRRATDPRDFIYGAAGLFDLKRSITEKSSFENLFGFLKSNKTNAKGPSELEAISKEELYMQFTCWCITYEGNLDIIQQIRNQDGKNSNPNLPSWATDWSKQEGDSFQTSYAICLLDKLNGAYEATKPPISRPSFFRREGNTLIVRGFIIDDLGPKLGWVEDNQGLLRTSTKSTKERMFRRALECTKSNTPHVNQVFLGAKKPNLDTFEKIYGDLFLQNMYASHLWRDGNRAQECSILGISALAKSHEKLFSYRSPALTGKGSVAITFNHFNADQSPKICYLIGGRSCFILIPIKKQKKSQAQLYTLGCGDCYLYGFQDDKALDMCKKLRLKEQDIHLV